MTALLEGTGALRERIGTLLTGSTEADFAVRTLRVTAIDLTPAELRGVLRCRLLVGPIEARMFDQITERAADPAGRERLELLRTFAVSGRVLVRSSRLLWEPDFSVYRAEAGFGAGLVGAHYFGPVYPQVGPTFTAQIDGAGPAVLSRRFNALWRDGRDVLPLFVGRIDDALR